MLMANSLGQTETGRAALPGEPCVMVDAAVW